MAIFLPSLKRNGRLENLHITVCLVGSRKLAIEDDYGSQGWSIFAPNLTIYGFDPDEEACKVANDNLQKRQVNWVEKHIPLALWSASGKYTLHITRHPACSSLYPPSEAYINRYAANAELIRLESTTEIETTTLDEFCQSEGVTEIDLIQLDVQGGELQVLQGATTALKKISAIRTEVEFTELYVGQSLFSDMDQHLRQQGFSLFDLSNLNHGLRRVPIASKVHPGGLIWADACYFRDFIQTPDPNPDKILKLACVADITDFPDYALELLVYLTLNYGQDARYNFTAEILESLSQIPQVVTQGLRSLPTIQEILAFNSQLQLADDVAALQQQALTAFLLEDYEHSSQYYEQLIELAPDLKSSYWYLGLILLLQGQEAEAQTTWFLSMAETTPDQLDSWTAELVDILFVEYQRRAAADDGVMAWIIEQHLRELAPHYFVEPPQERIKYSYLDEESRIEYYFDLLSEVDNEANSEPPYCVDIAASDGITMSNTYFLFKQGWSGLAVEGDRDRFTQLADRYSEFPNVNLSKCFVTPETVVSLLTAHQVPKQFSFLNLDIDSYDYYVLEQILTSFRPRLICVEINEKVPPPLRFTVHWDENFVYSGDHFYGQSICQLDLLCQRYNYALVELHYNNAFLIPAELSPVPALTPEDAYRQGYLERGDRQEKFPWNANVEDLLHLSPMEACDRLHTFFAKYHGQFTCTVGMPE
ncbi:MAG: FkbM family methyltransferase [Oculatellaceae cyanobacterium bins.114]|nr:FkbM family methyltransferase [Oculatellaceae cyanobacterium bins.114]